MLEYWEDIQDEAHRGIRGVPGDNRNQELHCKAALDPYSEQVGSRDNLLHHPKSGDILHKDRD